MKKSASTIMQWNLPLADPPAVPNSEQPELTMALMELLIQAARQIGNSATDRQQGDPSES
jgi:hypothetical protein